MEKYAKELAGKIEIPRLIDSQPAGGFLIGLAALCGLILAADGFDTQAIGYTAPAIVKDWGIEKQALGPVFSAGLFGLLIGALIAGPLADKIGRRPVMIAATAWFGAGALATAFAASLDELLWLRFLTGLGLGGAMPNTIALVSEYAPERRRATMITAMFCGFSIGAALGGVLATEIVPRFGWRAVFWIGGAVPLALLPLIVWKLPESLRVLVARKDSYGRIERILARMGGIDKAQFQLLIPAEDRIRRFPVGRLFSDGRAGATLFLWLAFFMNLLALYFMTNWLPIIAGEAGLLAGQAILVTAMFQAGGTIGAVVMGWLADRLRAQHILAVALFCAALLVAAMGLAGKDFFLIALLSFGAGFCIVGSQIGVNALAGVFYPSSIRSTGVGWALGIGRFGAAVGPLIGAALLAAKMPVGKLFLLGAIPPACAALALLAMDRVSPEKARSYAPSDDVQDQM
jgi:AAHS family 4-hydroxybenzoate transporter-like MFS transporter